MEHESSAGEDRAQTLALTRRSVVRAGAAAAWTAPLVQVLASAPAQAVGSSNALAITGTFSHAGGSRNFVFTGTITNNGSISTSALQCTIAWTTASGGSTWADNGGPSVGTNPSGWSNSGFTTSNANLTATVVFTRSTQLTAGSNTGSTVFTFVAANGGNTKNQGGSGSATATATSFTSANTGNSYSG